MAHTKPSSVSDGLLRPILWFTAASMLTTIAHEVTHACVAYVLGAPSTLFGYYVNVHWPSGQGTTADQALVGVSGPLFCLAFGSLAWFLFRRARLSATGLPLLFFTVFGTATFFGNLMSIAAVGDFSNVARLLNLPMGARFVTAVIGGIVVAAIHFWAGRELAQWVPASVSRGNAMLQMVALPVVAGTAAVVALNQPMPESFGSARVAEATFWVFAALGMWTAKRQSESGRGHLSVRWPDVAILVVAVVMVRAAVGGIPLTP